MAEQAQYDAFISYSHTLDGQIGPSLRDGLHRFARPWHRLRALRVFCDRRSMSANEGLWASIESALRRSRCFILLASPESAASEWVRREVAYWQGLEPRRPILIAVTGGEIVWDAQTVDFDSELTTALPENLRGWFSEEPLWVDLTKTRQDLSPRDPDFLDAIATLSAAVRGVDKDELIGEDHRQHRKARRFRRLAFAALSVLTVVALAAATTALVQRSQAIDQRDTALANQLVAEAGNVQDSQPGLARQLIAAAHHLKRTPQVESALAAGGLIPQEIHVDASALAYSADGEILAVARSGRPEAPGFPAVTGHVWLYDTDDLTVLSDWSTDSTAPIATAAISPAAPLLAVGQAGDIVLWDITNTRQPVKRALLSGHRDDVKAVEFSPDGLLLASGGRDGALRLWNVSDASTLAEVEVEQAGAAAFSMRFHANGTRLAVLSTPLRHLSAEATKAATDAASRTLATGMPLRTWDVSNPRAPQRTSDIEEKIDFFDLAGERLVTAARRDVRLGTITTGTNTSLPSGRATGSITALAHSAGGQVAAVGDDGYVRLWDPAPSLELVDELPIPPTDAENVGAFTFSPSGSRLAMAAPGGNAGQRATGIAGGTVRIWHLADSRERRAFAAITAHTSEVSELVASPDRHTLVSVGGDGLKLWDISNPHAPRSLANLPEAKSAAAVAFSPNGKSLAITSTGTVRLLDLQDPSSPRHLAVWQIPDTRGACRGRDLPCAIEPVALAFSSDGRLLAVGDITAQISIYDVTSSVARQPVGTIHANAWSLAFVPNKPVLAATGLSRQVELWDVTHPAAPEKRAVTGGHTYQIPDFSFSPDGSLFATASRDGTVRL
ncbi:TIR domain-containing protein [Lentzea aerocolonigenes]|uniref:TIR domain-containing protein n=1 Tax=Lentzea aerocolonigenes TaxID=68170 RepID=UPI0018C87A4B|nr:TIR domain-containing protein [Lentzea aerocolonigenes]